MFTKPLHDKFVYTRRMTVLSDIISDQLQSGSKVLDVGCGDGKIDKMIMEKMPSVDINGVDVLVRDKTYIPVAKFEGDVLPFDSNSFDTVIFIDVLHHVENPKNILAEAKRVARHNIIIKDHLREGFLAYSTLKFMDYVGNAHYGVVLPYNYLTKPEWEILFSDIGLTIKDYNEKLRLYPFPFNLLFDRRLHFVANLQK